MSAARPSGLRSLAIYGVLALVLLLAPVIFSDFFISVILTKALWLAIAAASLIFLAGYGGMVSSRAARRASTS